LVSQFEDPAEKLTVEVQKAHIDALSGSILRIEHHVLRVADKQPHYSQLLSVPGIGKILAMTSVLEAAEISRFPSPEDFRQLLPHGSGHKNQQRQKESRQ
jgi:transposase